MYSEQEVKQYMENGSFSENNNLGSIVINMLAKAVDKAHKLSRNERPTEVNGEYVFNFLYDDNENLKLKVYSSSNSVDIKLFDGGSRTASLSYAPRSIREMDDRDVFSELVELMDQAGYNIQFDREV